MIFAPPLSAAVLLRRRQRFFADVRDASGREFTVLCPNTGRMLGCAAPGTTVWLSRSDAAHRKLAHTWELSATAQALVGVHPGRANALVAEAIDAGVIGELAGYALRRGEVRYGERSRIDWLLQQPQRADCYVEVKSVTALDEHGLAFFPDAVSARGARHMQELAVMAAQGARAVVLFCVQRGDALALRAADEIDPAYGRALRAALHRGVEAYAYRAAVDTRGIALVRRIPVLP